MALELAMRSVADGSSASGHSANGRSRLAEARWHSGLLVGSGEMSSRGYDGMLPTFQKRRQAGEIRRRRAVDREALSASKHGQQHSTRRTPHICTSLVWLGFRCTPGTQKRFLAGIDRQALSLLARCPAKVGPGGPACMAWMGGVASLAALHSCIRAPPT